MISAEREAKLMRAKAALAGDMKKWCDEYDLTSSELLSLCAYMTGACIANQDQRTMTRERAMDVVIKNIEAGNAAVIAELMFAKGGRA